MYILTVCAAGWGCECEYMAIWCEPAHVSAHSLLFHSVRFYTIWVNKIWSIIVGTSLSLCEREVFKAKRSNAFRKRNPISQETKLASQPTIYMVYVCVSFCTSSFAINIYRHRFNFTFHLFFLYLSLRFFGKHLPSLLCPECRCKKIICLELTSMKSHIKYCNTRRHARATRIKRVADRERERKREAGDGIKQSEMRETKRKSANKKRAEMMRR